jgi:NAD(P)H-dependent FMN reductase
VLNLMIIVGSTRAGRGADNILPWLTTRARADGRFAVDVLDLRTWTLTLPI